MRQSESQITSDFGLLNLKWDSLEDLQEGMSTAAKQQVTLRIPRNFRTT